MFSLLLKASLVFCLSVRLPFFMPADTGSTRAIQRDTLPSNPSRMDSLQGLAEVVITGTRTARISSQSPVMVRVMDRRTMSGLQACVLSDALRFQPGLRVETNCQTCNYTQLRMNGLAGAYSQILVNGRPVFGPMMSLYGMEQLPVNMIERIEVVRGGGSSLYGSSAIGGTVNIITRTPDRNMAELGTRYQLIGGRTGEYALDANASLVAKDKRSGLSLFLNGRKRDMFDANADDFSELPALRNLSGGLGYFLKPSDNSKLEISLAHLSEYRYGGEMTERPVQFAQQAEQRRHRTWMAAIDHQYNFNEGRSSIIFYGALQHIGRTHYTGILPDTPPEMATHLQDPPFGNARSRTLNTGFQLNHRLEHFAGGQNTVTMGAEYLTERVVDRIPAYRYNVDQRAEDLGFFLQSDWSMHERLTLLSGLRLDRHNFLPGRLMWSPRMSVLYRPWPATQIRLGYGKGFRAPQAFDTDLHLAFAGGGVSRVRLSPDLQAETSHSWNISWNADHATEERIFGYTVELFRTRLLNTFKTEHLGEDAVGELFEKRNGSAATVQGVTVELRANLRRKLQVEGGFTWQQSVFAEGVNYVSGLPPEREFLRTPSCYGFATLTFSPASSWKMNLNHVYTGRMRLVHFAGEGNLPADRFTDTRAFHELNFRLAYTFRTTFIRSDLESFAGMRNILNAWQDDFDRGKYRDSNYIYGPAQPRTLILGIKFRFN